MKSGASISSTARRSLLTTRVSMKRRANAIFSSADIEVPPCQLVFLQRVGNNHDATRRVPAHRPAYSAKCVEEKFSEVWAVASRNSLYQIPAINEALGVWQRAKSAFATSA